MPGFRLADLPRPLLEKVLTKVDEKSYFRVQMASQGVTEFIRSSHNISVHLDGSFILEDTGSGSWELRSSNSILSKIDVDALHGIRLHTLFSPFFNGGYSDGQETDSNKALENLCTILKKNRITSTTAGILMLTWTTEQCLMLLKILKPLEVILDSEESIRYEALFHLKHLRKVDVRVNGDEAAVITTRLLSAFSEVTIRVDYPTPDPELQSLRSILQALCSKPFPNLLKFNYISKRESWPLPSGDELEEQLRVYNLVVEEGDGDDQLLEDPYEEKISASMQLNQHSGASCKLVIRSYYFQEIHLSFFH